MNQPEPNITQSTTAAAGFTRMSEETVAAEQARIMAEIEARQNAAQNAEQWVDRQGFRIGELQLLARFDATSELSELPAIFRLPGAPLGVKGLANLHGHVVPVFELAHFFAVTHRTDAKPMLLVLGTGDEAAGVIIDGLPQRKRFALEDAVTAENEPQVLTKYSLGSYRDASGIWTELDAERFFEDFIARAV
jgi:twitching motility protein PilI